MVSKRPRRSCGEAVLRDNCQVSYEQVRRTNVQRPDGDDSRSRADRESRNNVNDEAPFLVLEQAQKRDVSEAREEQSASSAIGEEGEDGRQERKVEEFRESRSEVVERWRNLQKTEDQLCVLADVKEGLLTPHSADRPCRTLKRKACPSGQSHASPRQK